MKPAVVVARQDENWIRSLPFPRVTTIVGCMDKPKLKGWAARMATEYLGEVLEPGKPYSEAELAAFLEAAKGAYNVRSDKAKEKGTQAHEWIKWHIYGTRPPLPSDPDVLSAVNAFLEWTASHEVVFLEPELSFAVQFLGPDKQPDGTGYKGTTDLLAWVDDLLSIVDYKASTGIYLETYLQTAGYAKGVQPLIVSGQKIEQRIALQIPKDGGPVNPVVIVTDLEEDFKAFLHCMGIRKYQDYQKAATARR